MIGPHNKLFISSIYGKGSKFGFFIDKNLDKNKVADTPKFIEFKRIDRSSTTFDEDVKPKKQVNIFFRRK